MQHQSNAMQSCIDACSGCHDTCLSTITHCLDLGGPHAASQHITLLADCAQICATSADFLVRGSPRHKDTCRVCAVVCRACAESCRAMGDDPVMKKCAEACDACAESCEQMAR